MNLPKLDVYIGGVSFVDKMLFTRRLAVMLKSGLALLEGMSILEDQASNPKFKEILGDVCKSIKNGQSLRKAMGKHPDVFDPLYTSIVGIGEESGNLEVNLGYLAAEMGKTYEFRQRVKSAMMYPVFVVTVALVVGSGVSLFVLPRMVDLFTSMDIKLPFTTKVIIWFANLMKNYGVWVIGSMFGTIIGSIVWTRTIGKSRWQRWLIRVPVWGRMLQNAQMAYFGRNLGLMLKSGLPLSDALAATAEAADNIVFREYATKLRIAVEKGKSMEKELTENKYKLFPVMAAKMIGVGERTGKLDETLMFIGDFYQEEVDNVTKNLSAVLEPVMLVVIAGIVLFLAMGIITPIYQFTGSVKK